MNKIRRNKSVLVIDDELPILTAITDKLTREGLTVLQARDGGIGLDIALREHPDVILLDIMMPNMDGITMLRHLRADTWGSAVRVIMLTNVTDTSNISEATQCGVHDFLVKTDWKLEDIFAKIKEYL